MKSLLSDIKTSKAQLNCTKAVVFLTFLVIPFLGGNDLALFYVNIDRFWIENIFTVLLIFSIALLYLGGYKNPSDFFRFFKFFLPFFALTIISLAYSWNPFGTVLSINVLVLAACSVYLFSICPWKTICLAGLVSGGAGCSISAFIQHLVLFPNLVSAFQQGMYAHILKEQSSIPFSSYSHHNMLGGYLAFIFPLALYFALWRKETAAVGASIAVPALIVAGVVLSSTRIGLGIVVLCLLAAFAFLLVGRRAKTGIPKICGVVVLAIIVSYSMLHMGGTPKGPGVQAVIVSKTKAVYKDLGTLNTRTDIWKNAYSAFKNKPVLGFGPGAFEYGYRRYYDGGSYTIAAHSTLVKTGVELGIAGILAFLFYLLGVALGVKHHSKEQEPVFNFLLLSALSGFLFGLIDFSFDVTSHVITFFVVTSYFFGTQPVVPRSEGNSRRGWKDFLVFFAATVCLVGSLGLNGRLGVYRAEMEAAGSFQEDGLLVPALGVYREAMKSMPFLSGPYAGAASVLVTAARAERNEKTRNEMIRELREYLDIMERMNDKDSERYLTLAQGFAALGDRRKADTYFGEAVKYYPSSPRYTCEIAAYYFSLGLYDEAIGYIRAFDRYIPKFRTPHNPRGVYIYDMRDLESSIEFARGNRAGALALARRNLEDAQGGVFVTTSARSKKFIARDELLRRLQERVTLLEGSRL